MSENTTRVNDPTEEIFFWPLVNSVDLKSAVTLNRVSAYTRRGLAHPGERSAGSKSRGTAEAPAEKTFGRHDAGIQRKDGILETQGRNR